ncbi:YhdP family protein [Luteimonas sp. RIT-PG2_3]
MSSLRRRLRLARRGLGYAVAVVLVLMALGAGLMSQLLPLAERHPDRIAAWLSERAGRGIAFDELQTSWTRRGPLLQVEGLRIGDGPDAVLVGSAEILVAQYAGLLPGRSFTELRLRGVELTLERSANGIWSVRGLPGQAQAGGDPMSSLEGLGELQVIDGSLGIHAPSLGIDTVIPSIDVRVQVSGNRMRVAARARMRSDAAPVQASFDLDRTQGSGKAYAIARDADLSAWSGLLQAGGIVANAGRGRGQAWVELRGNKVVSVTTDVVVDGLSLRGDPLHAGEAATSAGFERLTMKARWRSDGTQWRIDAPTLRLGMAAQPQSLDGLALAGGRQYGLRADRIDAGPLVAALSLSNRLPASLRQWLATSKPAAVLHDIRVSAPSGPGSWRGSSRIEGLGFAAIANRPGLQGLAGALSMDAQGLAFALDPAAKVVVDWPPAFDAPHPIQLRGELAAWRDGEGMRLETSALHVEGIGYAVDVRGGLGFQADGSRPVLDLAAAVAPAKVTLAKRFWIRHQMPESAVRWLDGALIAGEVRNGRAVISGDLDDWPFSALDGKASRGLFQADGDLVDVGVKFQPDWPAMERINGHVSFVGDGFSLQGTATMAGIDVGSIEASLPHYKQANLAVRAQANTDAAKLLALLKQSPLQHEHAETLEALKASGPAATRFALALALHAHGAPQIDGSVSLGGAQLSESRWDLAFSDVHGEARYDQHGFDAEGLRVHRDGQPGLLSLRAGEGHVRDRLHAFEADLDMSLSATDLLARAPDLGWLVPQVRGRSPWTIGVSIPKGATPDATAQNATPRKVATQKGTAGGVAPTMLRLHSNLVGTSLALPQPLRKPAAEALSTTIETPLPLGSGDITVAFADRLALRARTVGERTGVRVQLGSRQVVQAPPASGLVIGGRTPELDAIDWSALGGDGDGDGLALRSIDVQAERFRLFGSDFANTRISGSEEQGVLKLALEGATLAGSVQVPNDRRAAIVARLQRLYWPAPRPGEKAAALPAPAAPQATAQASASAENDTLHPASLPPLHIDVDDLRLGELQLGKAALYTQRIANGIGIERMQMRAPGQQVDVRGEWVGRGDSARTRLDVDVDSGDFGRVLLGMGLGQRINGGEGSLRFSARWPGSPIAFAPGALEGTLSVQIRDGQLAEVEPGAGRVLGLLSVAELPRRLMLDFRDFFAKGFTFNRIGGNIRIGDGIASSDDMAISGPAADIRIRGRADLRAQTHDQTIEVLPKAGNLLTAVGAIAAGPVGAAVGAVANAVLKRPLGEMTAKTYRVSGPWQDPKVDVIPHAGIGPHAKDASVVPPAVDPPAGP